MNDCMTFPDTVEEFMEQYKVVDAEHIYTNGSEFVPIFRMKQWFEHLPSEQSEPEAISKWKKEFREYVDSLDIARDDWKGIIEYIDELPSIQPNHCAEVGKKVLIDRQEALEIIRKMQTYKLFAGDDMILVDKAQVQTELMMLPSVQPEINCSEIPNNSDTISRQAVTKFLNDWLSCLFENCHKQSASDLKMIIKDFKNLPSAQPERKTGHWILDRSGAYCCSECMEPCAGYIMMKPRDKFCKMCGSRNEVME